MERSLISIDNNHVKDITVVLENVSEDTFYIREKSSLKYLTMCTISGLVCWKLRVTPDALFRSIETIVTSMNGHFLCYDFDRNVLKQFNPDNSDRFDNAFFILGNNSSVTEDPTETCVKPKVSAGKVDDSDTDSDSDSDSDSGTDADSDYEHAKPKPVVDLKDLEKQLEDDLDKTTELDQVADEIADEIADDITDEIEDEPKNTAKQQSTANTEGHFSRLISEMETNNNSDTDDEIVNNFIRRKTTLNALDNENDFLEKDNSQRMFDPVEKTKPKRRGRPVGSTNKNKKSDNDLATNSAVKKDEPKKRGRPKKSIIDTDDEDEPKKKRSQSITTQAIALFSKNRRSSIKEQYPDCTPTEIKKILGNMWKELSEERKEKFVRIIEDSMEL